MKSNGTELATQKAHDVKRGLRILIAEDYVDGAESMALLLRLCGHEVTIARNGQAALEIARAEKPDVVLLDLGLPLMSGYDVAKVLSQPRPGKSPLLIAVTGWGREEDRRVVYHFNRWFFGVRASFTWVVSTLGAMLSRLLS